MGLTSARVKKMNQKSDSAKSEEFFSSAQTGLQNWILDQEILCRPDHDVNDHMRGMNRTTDSEQLYFFPPSICVWQFTDANIGGNKQQCYGNPASTVIINQTLYNFNPQNQVQMQRALQSE